MGFDGNLKIATPLWKKHNLNRNYSLFWVLIALITQTTWRTLLLYIQIRTLFNMHNQLLNAYSWVIMIAINSFGHFKTLVRKLWTQSNGIFVKTTRATRRSLRIIEHPLMIYSPGARPQYLEKDTTLFFSTLNQRSTEHLISKRTFIQ